MGCVPSTKKESPVEIVDRTKNKRLLARGNDISQVYEVQYNHVCGTGFSGPVLLCVHTQQKKVYAVKSYYKSMQDKERVKMLQDEVNIYLNLEHPHIARLMDVFEDDEVIHLVMEYCSGGELYERLMKERPYTEEKAARASTEMLQALNYLHTKMNVAHRDLKLENWLYRDTSKTAPLKLIDFGFSTYYDKDAAPLQKDCGSTLYIAPEVLARSYDTQCDMWSFGVILFMLLSGQPPFSLQDGEEALMKNIMAGQYKMRSVWKSVSRNARELVQSLLVVAPKQRLTAAQALEHAWIKSHQTKTAEEVVLGESVLTDLRTFGAQHQLKRAAMCMMAYSLTSDEIDEIENIFKKFDTSNTGCITVASFLEVMQENFENLESDEISRLFASLAQGDKDAEISYNDFLGAMLQTRLHMHKDLIREVFDRMDTKQTGEISVQAFIQSLAADDPSLADQDPKEILREAGFDENKETITFDEFMTFCTATPPPDATGRSSMQKKQMTMIKVAGNFVDRQVTMVRNGTRVRPGQSGNNMRNMTTVRMTKAGGAFGQMTADEPASLEQLEFEAKLRKHGIDITLFGQGDAKKISDLFWETQKGESKVEVGDDGQLKRFLDVSRVELWAKCADGKRRVLVEAAQQLQDGRMRQGLHRVMAKKQMSFESGEETMRRALQAELNLPVPWQMENIEITGKEESQNERIAKGYPGVRSVYKFHTIILEVSKPEAATELGLPEGKDFMTEELNMIGTDRRHYWTWVEEAPPAFEENESANGNDAKKGDPDDGLTPVMPGQVE